MKRLIVASIFFGIFGCTKENTVKGNDWSFQHPSSWEFTHLGYEKETVLVGHSISNIGSGRMLISLSQGCKTPMNEETNPQRVLGRATKWVGGRLGYLSATQESSTIKYVAKIPRGKCTWTFTCIGDFLRSKEVGEICNSMISTLEFHR